MRAAIFLVFIFFGLCLNCDALNCRSDSGPKENELKAIYSNCLKRQNQSGRNTSRNRGYGEDDWKDPRGYSQRDRAQTSQWDKDGRRHKDDGDRDDYLDEGIDGKNDRASNRDDRMGKGIANERFGNRDERISNDRMGHYGYGRDQVSSRDEIGRRDTDEYGNEFPSPYNGYHSPTPPVRRYKREKRLGVAAGQRSRYNPNTSSPRPSGYDDSYRSYDRNERNSSDNESKKYSEINKACALQCFMESLEMTGDNGKPDKYLVTHVITKDVRNEDLRDFLQESIEECFQILNNENTEEKCEFSKNLLLCLSEKGRANCDDWKDDIQF